MAAWPALALACSYELLMMVSRSPQVPADVTSETGHDADILEAEGDGKTGLHPGSRAPSMFSRSVSEPEISPGGRRQHM